MIVSATVSVDDWDKGFGMVYGTLSAVMLLKNTERTSFSLGVMGRTLFSSMPVIAPNKPFLNESGQSHCIRQVYFRFQYHGTTIYKCSLVLQGRSVQGTGCRNACCRYASPCACKKSKRPTTSYLSTCWVACRVTCWVLVGYLLGQGTKKSELWGNCMTTMG